MAAEILAKTGHETELVEGETGSFEVFKGSVKIFSKLETGRFPTASNLIEQITA